MPAAVVVLAAGAGARVGAAVNKVLLPLGGASALAHSLRAVLAVPDVLRVVVVVRDGEREAVEAALAPELGEREVRVVVGGRTRHDSEWAALRVLRDDVESGAVDVVAIHDAARPLAPPTLFSTVIAAAREHGGALPGVPVTALVARADPTESADATGGADPVVAVQTPQAFRASVLLAAYARAEAEGFVGTDTASALERYAGDEVSVVAVPGSLRNLKITWVEDLTVAERLL